MTVNSLINFGVPGIKGQRSAPLQPIIRNKFRVLFTKFGKPDDDTYVVTQQIRSVSLPPITQKSDTIIHLYDDVSGGAMGKVLNQCARQRDQNIVDAYFQMKIEFLAGGAAASGPDVLRTYEFTNCTIQNVQSIQMDYSEPAALEFTIEISNEFLHIYDGEMKRLW